MSWNERERNPVCCSYMQLYDCPEVGFSFDISILPNLPGRRVGSLGSFLCIIKTCLGLRHVHSKVFLGAGRHQYSNCIAFTSKPCIDPKCWFVGSQNCSSHGRRDAESSTQKPFLMVSPFSPKRDRRLGKFWLALPLVIVYSTSLSRNFAAPSFRGIRASQLRRSALSPVITAWQVQQERDREYDELLRGGFSKEKMLLHCTAIDFWCFLIVPSRSLLARMPLHNSQESNRIRLSNPNLQCRWCSTLSYCRPEVWFL